MKQIMYAASIVFLFAFSSCMEKTKKEKHKTAYAFTSKGLLVQLDSVVCHADSFVVHTTFFNSNNVNLLLLKPVIIPGMVDATFSLFVHEKNSYPLPVIFSKCNSNTLIHTDGRSISLCSANSICLAPGIKTAYAFKTRTENMCVELKGKKISLMLFHAYPTTVSNEIVWSHSKEMKILVYNGKTESNQVQVKRSAGFFHRKPVTFFMCCIPHRT